VSGERRPPKRQPGGVAALALRSSLAWQADALGLPSLLRPSIASGQASSKWVLRPIPGLTRRRAAAGRTFATADDGDCEPPKMGAGPDCASAGRLPRFARRAKHGRRIVLGKLICGVDESEEARAAVRVAKSLARDLDRRLVLVHAVQFTSGFAFALAPYAYPHRVGEETARRAGQQLLDRVADESGLSASVERRIEAGEPAALLARIAGEEPVDLVVVGARSRGLAASAFLGSVLTAVVGRACCPVVVVPAKARLGAGPVICAADESEEAHGAARVARRLADRLGVDLLVAHAVAAAPVPSTSAVPNGPAELLDAERRRAEELLAGLAFEHGFGTEVERRVAYGSEAEAIGQLAEEEDATLVVVGARRRGTLLSLIAGSVSTELPATSLRPTVVVPAGARLAVAA
jgi:nucleotide-binding universal stress UspA family protein